MTVFNHSSYRRGPEKPSRETFVLFCQHQLSIHIRVNLALASPNTYNIQLKDVFVSSKNSPPGKLLSLARCGINNHRSRVALGAYVLNQLFISSVGTRCVWCRSINTKVSSCQSSALAGYLCTVGCCMHMFQSNWWTDVSPDKTLLPVFSTGKQSK